MAKLLKKGGNVLLLDEPTNDLDVETLRALEEGLLAFPEVQLLYLMIDGFLIVYAPIFWHSRVIAKLNSMMVTILIMNLN